MITILRNENNNIIYECDCGVKGKCMIKPLDNDAAIVVDVRCPICLEVKRVVLTQYGSEENKKEIIDNLDKGDLSWSLIISNDIIEYALKKDDEEE